ncbi:hypothetical protein COT75_04310 [Candidatus Beckwithbacteria bacterium CG10_big_fil_rev_8_21_14_0_10_34_10]|uniref:Uncharacterized protein n=1 Tax=Candidatus Beckwithbacteria bacterium CG10_big_fil_rev_8_21_14_0_10_34_10 TaxID=1974495 RepID=A0A2H0W885_9BACT|nr:MAG: hypothetical protein COT75_04310 [Candidatus Beckwithbacteria bacterium CG10_big_fil_rev_8_21_14_0_10_34_10]
MSISKNITLNTGSQAGAKIIVVIFGVLSTILLRRYLGRSLYGDFVFVFSLATMLSTLADFGSHLITVREASQNKLNAGLIIGNVFVLRFAFSLLASIPLVFLGIKSGYPLFLKTALLVSSLIIFLISFKNSLMIIFHTRLKLFYYSLMNIFISGFNFLGIVFFYSFARTKEISYFVSSQIMALLITVLIFTPLALKLIKLNFKLNKKIVKRIILQSAPMGGILLMFTFYSRVDTLILKHFQGSEAVGIYGLTYKVFENLNVFASYLMNSLLPVLSEMAVKKDNQIQFKKMFQIAFDLLFSAGLLITILLFIFSPLIIKILTGSVLVSETLSLRILSFALFFSFLNHLTGYSIIALGEQKKSFFIAALALVFNFSINFVLVPLFSFKAAAINTILTEVLVFSLTVLVIRKKLGGFLKLNTFLKTTTSFLINKGRIFNV